MSYTCFPPGKYYIGDLCYVINDKLWDRFCEMTTVGYDVLDGYFKWEDKFLWTHSTAYGDGGYFDNHGKEYCVDAGLIGVLPFDLISKHLNGVAHLGNVVEFAKPFTCEYDDGKFFIGDDITIDTDPSYHEDEEEEYDDSEA